MHFIEVDRAAVIPWAACESAHITRVTSVNSDDTIYGRVSAQGLMAVQIQEPCNRCRLSRNLLSSRHLFDEIHVATSRNERSS